MTCRGWCGNSIVNARASLPRMARPARAMAGGSHPFCVHVEFVCSADVRSVASAAFLDKKKRTKDRNNNKKIKPPLALRKTGATHRWPTHRDKVTRDREYTSRQTFSGLAAVVFNIYERALHVRGVVMHCYVTRTLITYNSCREPWKLRNVRRENRALYIRVRRPDAAIMPLQPSNRLLPTPRTQTTASSSSSYSAEVTFFFFIYIFATR